MDLSSRLKVLNSTKKNRHKYTVQDMIIAYPTGLYQDAGQLPKRPEDAGDVTFVISSEVPTRSTEITLQLPVAEELRPRDGQIYDDKERRVALGELVFTLVESSRSQPGTNKKTFSIGQFLEFDDEDIVLPDMLGVPKNVDLQHNTNLLDLEDAGLTDDEITQLQDMSVIRKKELESLLVSYRIQTSDKQVAISENQKKLNETRKLIAAVGQLPDSSSILTKLTARETALKTERDTLIDDINTLGVLVTETYNALLKVSELVR